jgi:RNA polymerase sigma factor (sigma-70 family)
MAGISLSDLFERTWRERSPMWKAYAQRLTGNPADAEDVVLEATTRTLATEPGLDSEGRLHAYVTAAIRHIAFEVVRKRRREMPFDGEAHLVRRRYASSALQLALSGEALKQRRSLAAALRGEMATLPETHRQAVEWMVLRTPPLKLREVAERQGVATSTVHYRLNRGLEALADAVLGGVDFDSLGLS